MKLPIYSFGHPILRQKSEVVADNEAQIDSLIEEENLLIVY